MSVGACFTGHAPSQSGCIQSRSILLSASAGKNRSNNRISNFSDTTDANTVKAPSRGARFRWSVKREEGTAETPVTTKTTATQFLAAIQLIAAIKQCTRMQDLKRGKKLHQDAVAAGLHTGKSVAAALIRMYAKCRNMPLAREVFDNSTSRDVVLWGHLILGYVENNESSVALDLFTTMDCEPEPFVYTAVLKACGNLASQKESDRKIYLQKGTAIHKHLQGKFDSDVYVSTSLVDMYSKCGSMQQARQVFDGMSSKTVVTWTTMIMGYVQNGESLTALSLFAAMDCKPNNFTYATVLKACWVLAGEQEGLKQFCLQKGVEIHKQVKDGGFENDIVVASSLVDMYGKCGSMQHAREVFDKMISKGVVAWTSLLMGYVENGNSSVAMDLFQKMECEPNAATYVAVLKACGCLARENPDDKDLYLKQGATIHKQLRESGLESNILVANSLLSMYSKCCSMQHAREVFDRMVHKNVISWSVLIRGYAQTGESSLAMELFTNMDCEPTSYTFVAALKACSMLASEDDSEKHATIEKGIAIHKRVTDRGLESETAVANALIAMYSKCGSMQQAREVFDRMTSKDVVAWNTLISGYVETGETFVALGLVSAMDCEPDHFTYATALKACAVLAGENESDKQFYLDKGIGIHEEVKQRGLDPDAVLATALLDMYGKCGSMRYAREVFDGMIEKNVVTWNAIIQGYVENKDSSSAMELFACMDCKPGSFTCATALKACGFLACDNQSEKQHYLEMGMAIHKQVQENHGFNLDVVLTTGLITMYCKCGSTQQAREVFDNSIKDSGVWTSLITGYLENGESLAALDLFTSMDCEPGFAAYTAALRACGDSGALAAGQQIHARVCRLGMGRAEAMAATLVFFYGKCGSMTRAEELFSNIHSPDAVSWHSLLTGYACLGEQPFQVFNLVKKMQEAAIPMNPVTFSCILTACSHTGLVEEGKQYFELMLGLGLSPELQNYSCMVDMLGRANRLQEALDLVRNMPFEADTVVWLTLLGACKKWRNPEIGKVAFDALVAACPTEGAAYVMMSEIYRTSNSDQTKE